MANFWGTPMPEIKASLRRCVVNKPIEILPSKQKYKENERRGQFLVTPMSEIKLPMTGKSAEPLFKISAFLLKKFSAC